MKEITYNELESLRASGQPFHLVDVREESEREAYHIGGEWIPLGELMRHAENMPTDRPVIFYCRKGIRSAIAVQRMETALQRENCWNLKGGIGER